MENEFYYMVFQSFLVTITFITMFAACLCCRKKVPKNELLGLEGMVKIKNPDENLQPNGIASLGNSKISSTSITLSSSSSTTTSLAVTFTTPTTNTVSADGAGVGGGGGVIVASKRTSNAPHRSLPDIPITEPIVGDTNSDLYATVGDKVQEKPQGRSPTTSLKKQASVSQHSSLSQADDIISPYARVKSPPHSYDKVRPAEHPYAQLNSVIQSSASSATSPSTTTTTTTSTIATTSSSSTPFAIPSTSNHPHHHLHLHQQQQSQQQQQQQHHNQSQQVQLTITTSNGDNGFLNGSRRGSNQSLLGEDGHQIIPAASAIAGRISASQELPYMTPPIMPTQQHFSGDSQDSSKGYTSISVREPLANIIAQTNNQNAHLRRRDLSDSHYATVSDDSDEMYAAIDDPNLQGGDLYTSGSETYAQIQPPHSGTLTVSAEIHQNQQQQQVQQQQQQQQQYQHHQQNAILKLNNNNQNNNNNNSNNNDYKKTDDDTISTLAASSAVIVAGTASTIAASTSSGNVPYTTTHLLQQRQINPLVHIIPDDNNDLLKNVHSRQASNSSCTSSVGNLGSPKPEKRQANSPLPPTPKNSHNLSISNLTINQQSLSSSSARNSIASNIIDGHQMSSLPICGGGGGEVASDDCGGGGGGDGGAANFINRNVSKENILNENGDGKNVGIGATTTKNTIRNNTNSNDDDIIKRKSNPSKDLEGMYAKVMKKNKLSNAPSQNTSPVSYRKSLLSSAADAIDGTIQTNLSDLDIVENENVPEYNASSLASTTNSNNNNNNNINYNLTAKEVIDNNYETIDNNKKQRLRSNIQNVNYDNKDPGYETIPADKKSNTLLLNQNYYNSRNSTGGDGNSSYSITNNTSVGDSCSSVRNGNNGNNNNHNRGIINGAADRVHDTQKTRSSAPGILSQGIQKVSQESLQLFHEMDRHQNTSLQQQQQQQNKSGKISPTKSTIQHQVSVPLIQLMKNNIEPSIFHSKNEENEPGYESLPDIGGNRSSHADEHQLSSLANDPGYETVTLRIDDHPKMKLPLNKTNSDYDPNYEVLRLPNNVISQTHVTTSTNNSNSSNTVKLETMTISTTSATTTSSTTITQTKTTTTLNHLDKNDDHDEFYEKICEKQQHSNDNNDGYSSIRSKNYKQNRKLKNKNKNYDANNGGNNVNENDQNNENNNDDDDDDGGGDDDDDDDDEELPPGYSSIKDKNKLKHHDYASILESNNRIVSDDDNSDIYTSIPSTITHNMPHALESQTLQIKKNHNYSTIAEIKSSSSSSTVGKSFTETSPNSPNSSISPIDHRLAPPPPPPPLPPLSSSLNNNTVRSHRILTNSNSNQYESLTGSESDPNYECVNYRNIVQENPYERLHNEVNDRMPIKVHEQTGSDGGSTILIDSLSQNMNDNKNNSNTLTSNNSVNIIDDYFQV